MNMPGEGSPLAEEMLRYKPIMGVLAAGYLVVIIMEVVSGNDANIVNDLLVFIAALSMALSTQQGFMQCAMPFALLATVAAVFDFISLISLFALQRSLQHPGIDDAFSSDCPYDFKVKLGNDVTVTKGSLTIPLSKDTEVEFPVSLCNWKWVLGNVAILVSVLLDVIATMIGCRLFRAMRAAGGGGDGFAPGMGGLGPAAGMDPGGSGGASGPGFAGFGGQGNTLGGNPGAGGPAAGPTGPRAGLFQGQGQTLGS